MKHIPNLFTLLNLLFGCIAIVFILQNGIIILVNAEGTELLDIPEKVWMASLFIGLAAIVDFLDGFVARLFGASSEMGKQLDSLADLVSFGVAPALILYQFLRLSYANEPDGVEVSMLWLLPVFLLPCAAAYRLARFNLDKEQTFYFKGMPVPAAGILVASLPLIYFYNQSQVVADLLTSKWLIYGLTLLLSWLMVSTLPLMAMKFKNFRLQDNFPRYLLLVLALVGFLLLKWMAVPVVILAYVLLSLLFKNKVT
ncbi:MAG: CDP-alcohol phosphatidyltransferase family protein [Chitinophagaceae bacterium]|nr:CDP-alcohol phosphatidyltransferase family protein [Chitinophagaceae bacterium]